MLLSMLYMALSCAIHSSKLFEPGCMDFWRAMFSMNEEGRQRISA